MLDARAKLASHIQHFKNDPKHFKDISETVLNFFEDLGIAYENKCINYELAYESFSYHLCRYWWLLKPYIEYQRKLHNSEDRLFDKFEMLSAKMDGPKDVGWKERFLDDEQLVAKQAIFELQHHSILLQQFENSFFQLLQMLDRIVGELKCQETILGISERGSKVEHYTGRACFCTWYSRLSVDFNETMLRRIANVDLPSNQGLPRHVADERIVISYFEEFYQPRQASLGHYFRVLYHIIKFVDSPFTLSASTTNHEAIPSLSYLP